VEFGHGVFNLESRLVAYCGSVEPAGSGTEVVDLKLIGNIYLVVAAVVASSLLFFGFGWCCSGIGGGFTWRVLIWSIWAAVGVVWLSWYWLRLGRVVTSMANRFGDDRLIDVGLCSGAILKELDKAIDEKFSRDRECSLALKRQIEDLQIRIQLSQRQTRNIGAIIYSISDSVMVIDEFDKLLMANEAAGALFDFDFRSSQHKSVGELISADKSEFVDFLRRCRQTKERHTRREIVFVKEGKTKTYDCIVSCVYDSKEQICWVVAVLHDVTREKEISRMKSDFVGYVSHELKTPISVITAYSEMLADGEVDDEETKKEFYSVIRGQAERLTRLIEDILNISRIESGLVKVTKKPLSLAILIEEQLQMIKNYAEEKNITVISQKPIVFDQIYADKDMILEVIINLLSNAIKYTNPGGSVEIKMEVDEIAAMARVTVTDTGVGIPEGELEHIFDKFYRVEANKERAEGTGLGLNLVKQIVEKVHNGRVFVRSKVGQGSTFGFELPLAMAEAVKV
jgi:two-component system phosphate regulon sensor histidine kinase PhoR